MFRLFKVTKLSCINVHSSFVITSSEARVFAQSHACNFVPFPVSEICTIARQCSCSHTNRARGNVKINSAETYADRDIASDSQVLFNMPKRKLKKHVNHPKKVQKFAHEEQYKDVEYFYENGLRKIKPYVYQFETHAKGRWFGCKLLDVFKKEFRLESPEYYATAIDGGLIKVNKTCASPDRILKNNDFMQSKVHRHEPPVSAEPIHIIAMTDEYLVINKPASIPVHPCGKYRHNTIVFILGREHGLHGLHTIHRLDRLTSGLLLFARTLDVSHRVDAYVRDRRLEKTYMCMVKGEFPSDPFECNQPIFIVSHKIGVCRVKDDGKACMTRFERLSYDGETSIVKCYPHTGRMHQIRVHLQYLGFPIINDPLYNNEVWGPETGKGGNVKLTDEQLLKDLIEQHDMEIDLALEKARLQKTADDREVDNSSDTVHSCNEETPKTDETQMVNCLNNIEDVVTGGSNCASNLEGEVRSMSDDGIMKTASSCIQQGSDSRQELLGSQKSSDCDNVSLVNKDVSINSMQSESMGTCSMKQDSKENNVTGYNSGTTTGITDKCEVDNDISCRNKDPISDQHAPPQVQLKSDVDNQESQSQHLGVTELSYPMHKNSTAVCTAEVKKSVTGSVDTVKSALTGSGGGDDIDEERMENERTDKLAMSLCRECREPMPDPEPHEMCIYLHALTYKGPDFEFSVPMPAWAIEHFKRTGVNYE